MFGYRINRFGEPILQFSAAEYEETGEEKIIPKPIPVTFDPKGVTNYAQTLDMKTGELKTSWQQNDDSITVTSVVDSAGRLIRKIAHTKPELLEIKVDGGDPSSIEPDLAFDEAKGKCEAEWETDIEIEGPVVDQQAIRSFLFYLRRAIHPSGKMSVSPYALSNKTYNGHIFWDADIWVFPAIALLDPARASTIPGYRVHMLPAARRNFQAWVKAGKPTGAGALVVEPRYQAQGAKFPWESSVTGQETVKGESKFQDHITGSIAWSVSLANALGITKDKEILPAAAAFYQSRSVVGPNGREINGTMSPDEFHTGNNDLYTNLLAQWCMNGGKWEGDNLFKLPAREGSFLTYDGDKLRAYKQAAAVLAIFPLQFPAAVAQSKEMMARFSTKVTPNGPAMSDSIHALIEARMGDSDRAYETWHKSWRPFTDHPLLLFSEKRSRASTYFVTGAAGCLQTVLFGFLNLRIGPEKPVRGWARPLKNGFWLTADPKLPKQWKSVKLKGISILGRKETLIFDANGVRSGK